MAGERDLSMLLQHMTPQLQPGTFVFCTFTSGDLPAGLTPIATFREAQGLSAIVALDKSEHAGVRWRFESGLIALTIHSSLDALAFLVGNSAVLKAGIPCNALPAFHHDYLFVQRDMA